LDQVPDGRFFPYITYDKRFLLWWGVSLFMFQLAARRQLDFELDSRDTHVLDNLNRLADTEQTTRPVHKTLNHFLGKSSQPAYPQLRTQMLRRLIRMKALDAGRLLGHFVVPIDGTGQLCFRERHCPYCLVQCHETYTLYMHQVLEAKLLGPGNLTLSMGSEFIDNRDQDDNATGTAEERKQDCELKALARLLPALRRDYPQLRLCLAGDSLYACGRTFQLAKDYDFAYVLTFKEGHMPAVWADFQSLLPLCPENVLQHRPQEGVEQVYRWVHDLSYADDQGRRWTFHALQCEETIDGETTRFAWLTRLPVSKRTVVEIAEKGGRGRWHIENQGFNRQKNSGFNLEHVYSTQPELFKTYYYLLQIAHMIMLVLENGNLLRRLAAACSKTPLQLFGSLKNIARRLLESFRYRLLRDEAFDAQQAARIQIRFDSS
jgi:hypothetical protein